MDMKFHPALRFYWFLLGVRLHIHVGIKVNSLRPSDAIWRQKSGSTLAQVMACCLMAPSHYLTPCWFIISKVQWHSSKGKFTRDTSAINHWNYLKNEIPKISFKFLRGQWVSNYVSKRGSSIFSAQRDSIKDMAQRKFHHHGRKHSPAVVPFLVWRHRQVT